MNASSTPYTDRHRTHRIVSLGVTAVMAVVFLVGFLLILVAYQMTSSQTGQRILQRSVAVITDIDAVLPGIETSLRETAETAEGPTVTVPDFPIPVELTREEAETLSGSDLRARLLEDAAATLYSEGSSAWADADPDAIQRVERVSTAGVLHRSLGFVTRSYNRLFFAGTTVLGVLAAGFTALLVTGMQWRMRLVALGGVITAAALPLLAGAVGVRFAMRTGQTEADRFVWGILDLGIDASWVAIRDYFTLSILGAIILLMASLMLWWDTRTYIRQPPQHVDTSP